MTGPTPQPLTVICLCADWCTACREFAPAFAALRHAHPGDHFRWVDIEDEPELLGELDITTFPTLLIASAAGLQFAGGVLPQPSVVERLIGAARSGAGAVGVADALLLQYRQVLAAATGDFDPAN
jgi:thiol-disulfide isomerase/thioredoxin